MTGERGVTAWVAALPGAPGAEARAFAAELRTSITVAEVLLRRGFTEPAEVRRFFAPKLAELTPPGEMAGRAEAAARLARAVEAGERVCVFGDYDCDGITAAAILTGILRSLGGEATPLLASRFGGGYGVTAEAVERILGTGATLLVTCDCGSSDHASLREVRARGVDVIVIDHHVVPDEPLPALAFLNPHRPECGFPYKGLASCGLVLSVGAALRAKLGRALDLKSWLDLVALGTIADVAPLDGDNRALVRAGLGVLAEARRPGVRALIELAKLDAGRALTAEDVAFRLAPRINAPGRMGSPDLALALLLAGSDVEARGLAARIEQLSVERKTEQERLIAEAEAEIEREGWGSERAIVVGHHGWNHGLVGIVAGRLADRYRKPVAVVGFEGERGRGSVRAPAGSRLVDVLSSVSDVLVRYGGHQAAAGFEVETGRFAELRTRFAESVEKWSMGSPSSSASSLGEVTRLCPEDELTRVVEDLERLEPCGEGNPAPRIALEASLVSARAVKGGHLKLDLAVSGGQRLSGFGPSMGERAESLGGRVLVVGRLAWNAWRGGRSVEIRVDAIDG